MTELQVYLWLMLDNIKITIEIVGSAGTFVMFFVLLIGRAENSFSKKEIANLRKLLVFFVLLLFTNMFIPTSKQYAVIKVLPKIANSELVKTDMPDMYNMAMSYLRNKSNEGVSK